jgi:hypothetical protein
MVRSLKNPIMPLPVKRSSASPRSASPRPKRNPAAVRFCRKKRVAFGSSIGIKPSSTITGPSRRLAVMTVPGGSGKSFGNSGGMLTGVPAPAHGGKLGAADSAGDGVMMPPTVGVDCGVPAGSGLSAANASLPSPSKMTTIRVPNNCSVCHLSPIPIRCIEQNTNKLQQVEHATAIKKTSVIITNVVEFQREIGLPISLSFKLNYLVVVPVPLMSNGVAISARSELPSGTRSPGGFVSLPK